MKAIMNHPMLKLKRASDTQWLSMENAVDALGCCFSAVKAVLEHDANESDATALGCV